jgi:hypothetical protein
MMGMGYPARFLHSIKIQHTNDEQANKFRSTHPIDSEKKSETWGNTRSKIVVTNLSASGKTATHPRGRRMRKKWRKNKSENENGGCVSGSAWFQMKNA